MSYTVHKRTRGKASVAVLSRFLGKELLITYTIRSQTLAVLNDMFARGLLQIEDVC